MSFKKAKTVMTVLLALGAVICVLALITFRDGSPYVNYAIFAAIALIIVAFIICYLWCRCPNCGARIIRNVLKLKACPYCGKDFETGKKVMKVKK